MALGLVGRGAGVAISALGVQALTDLAGLHPGLHPEPLDVTDAAQGPLDLAVFNAGIYRPIPRGLAPPEVFALRMRLLRLLPYRLYFPMMARLTGRPD
jgi:hypothetical protein